jgi:hypothetical protein
MRLLLSIVVAIGFAVVVVLGAASVVRDLLALTKHRPPSVFDELREDDQEAEDRIAEVHRLTPSMHRRAARLPRISMQLTDLLNRRNTP